jgi:8-oxo-dGTP pyrophosphatase MutT (NUDIX family)
MVCDQLSAPRAVLLEALRRHENTCADLHEREMTQATIAFVETHAMCAERSLAVGHLTGSAWIVDPSRTRVLLTHHAKLNKWLQLGGHADGDLDLYAVALKEAREESGLETVRLISADVFDVDRHWIPDHRAVPGHYHYDVRYLFEADPREALRVSAESKAVAWVELSALAQFTTEESMLRMARKTRSRACG